MKKYSLTIRLPIILAIIIGLVTLVTVIMFWGNNNNVKELEVNEPLEISNSIKNFDNSITDEKLIKDPANGKGDTIEVAYRPEPTPEPQPQAVEQLIISTEATTTPEVTDEPIKAVDAPQAIQTPSKQQTQQKPSTEPQKPSTSVTVPSGYAPIVTTDEPIKGIDEPVYKEPTQPKPAEPKPTPQPTPTPQPQPTPEPTQPEPEEEYEENPIIVIDIWL